MSKSSHLNIWLHWTISMEICFHIYSVKLKLSHPLHVASFAKQHKNATIIFYRIVYGAKILKSWGFFFCAEKECTIGQRRLVLQVFTQTRMIQASQLSCIPLRFCFPILRGSLCHFLTYHWMLQGTSRRLFSDAVTYIILIGTSLEGRPLCMNNNSS